MKQLPLLALFFSLAVSSCATSPPLFTAAKYLPTKIEPSHDLVSYSSTNVVMTVRMSSSDVIALVQKEFAGQFSAGQSDFNPKGEELISVGDSYFRRVNLEYVEYASAGMHGACTQQIFVWFAADGSYFGAFPQQALCPV